MSKEDNHPKFVHFGTSKSGSATLSYFLPRHPQVYASGPKELIFVNHASACEKGLNWYAETYFANHVGQSIICDQSIGYSEALLENSAKLNRL